MEVVKGYKLSKDYRHSKALKNLHFTINENKISGLIGRNGAGKTTLLKIMAGFIKPSDGEVLIFGERPFNSLKASANTILVDDMMSFPTSLNLGEILEVAGRFYPNWDAEMAKKLFQYFHFFENQRHDELSKGKRSTFNMIVGLSSRCPLTMFDEPTTGMDAAVRKDFYRALLKEYLAHPRTIIISSHHLEEMEDILEEILLIHNGEKQLHLPIENFKEYAIGVIGPSEIVKEWSHDKTVLFLKELSPGSTYIVIESLYKAKIHQEASHLGLKLSPVSPSDLCVYLTSQTKGGIDDVFK
ncbi:ATP-binding cassette domain-containing protein [Sutcliffiella rhizosphaerae]|uniref:Vitamin B12 import ATP-binding protein BtuD n=1 Tax=Sutcliffiella rhizosphaerae TaxID=2880967 RepID=A0ABN8A9M9_9BACI|nr:ABC transporter ATP-binding protein [Sutcliffiella rhizosphaerae]CAG9621870.1 Vitamin B12 import ATP-binding protein BtuD [Sutcliffiella rhizosphaerae]